MLLRPFPSADGEVETRKQIVIVTLFRFQKNHHK